MIEFSSHGEAEYHINRVYWLRIYPMSAYINANSVPRISEMKMDVLYELPFNNWMKQYCFIESPFKMLKTDDNSHNNLPSIKK